MLFFTWYRREDTLLLGCLVFVLVFAFLILPPPPTQVRLTAYLVPFLVFIAVRWSCPALTQIFQLKRCTDGQKEAHIHVGSSESATNHYTRANQECWMFFEWENVINGIYNYNNKKQLCFVMPCFMTISLIQYVANIAGE